MSNLQQCKVERAERDFTILSNTIARDKELSLKAKGLLLVVFSLNERSWDFSINGLCKIVKEGKSAVYNAIDELKEHGYCSCYQQRGIDGQLGQVEYTFYEHPNDQVSENKPLSDYQQADNPQADNQTQLNTEINKTTNNKNISTSKFDFRAALLSLGVKPEVADTWIAVRKKKSANNSELAFNSTKRQIDIAYERFGASPNTCIRVSAENSWMGFKAEWLVGIDLSFYDEEERKNKQIQFPIYDDNGEWQG